MNDTTELARNIRASIIDHVELISNAERQLEYERNVPHVWVIAEFQESWYDVYVPDSPAMSAAFSDAQLSMLSHFNEDLVTAFDQIDPLPELVSELLEHPRWRDLMVAACRVLKELADQAT